MKITNQRLEVGYIGVLTREVSNFHIIFEKGDKVKVTGICDRGYNLEHIETGYKITECGWDVFN